MGDFFNDQKREFHNRYNENVTVNGVKTVSASKTRPSDTTTYASGEVLNESDSAGTVWTFSNCAYRVAGEGVITRAKITDSSNQSSLYPRFELWLFHTSPAADNDNAAFTPTDAELLNVVGIIPFPIDYEGTTGAGDTGNSIHVSGNVHLPFNCAAADANLYGVLVLRNAYVPISAEAFKIELEIL